VGRVNLYSISVVLIVVVYAIARLIQVPLEMSANQELWLKLPYMTRVFIVAGVSLAGVLILLVLALLAIIGVTA
jgi:hypothetical protein